MSEACDPESSEPPKEPFAIGTVIDADAGVVTLNSITTETSIEVPLSELEFFASALLTIKDYKSEPGGPILDLSDSV